MNNPAITKVLIILSLSLTTCATAYGQMPTIAGPGVVKLLEVADEAQAISAATDFIKLNYTVPMESIEYKSVEKVTDGILIDAKLPTRQCELKLVKITKNLLAEKFEWVVKTYSCPKSK